jgi:hypothetical protein
MTAGRARTKAMARTTADPSLTTPRLKKAPGAPCTQDDTVCVGIGRCGVRRRWGRSPRPSGTPMLFDGFPRVALRLPGATFTPSLREGTVWTTARAEAFSSGMTAGTARTKATARARERTTADPSLTTPRLKKAPGAPCTQDDTACVGIGRCGVRRRWGAFTAALRDADAF